MDNHCISDIIDNIGKPQKLFTFKKILDDNWDRIVQKPPKFISPEQYQAVNKIRLCRSQNLGADHYACSDCGTEFVKHFNCKHRFCSNCGWVDTLKWADKLVDNMVDIPHRHAVITLPHSFNPLFYSAKKLLLETFIKSAAYTIKEVMLDFHHVKIGLVSVLHTYGEQKKLHIHTHMIFSWGGINKDMNIIKLAKNLHIDYQIIKDRFRDIFLEAMLKIYDHKDFKSDFKSFEEYQSFLNNQRSQAWIAYLDTPMQNPYEVIKYIGRYSKRSCISDYKIVHYNDQSVGFKYKDYKELDLNNKPIEKICILPTEKFIFRVLNHVPLKGFRLVRYYGFYANRRQVDPKTLMKNNPVYQESKKNEVYKFDDCNICKHCGGKMKYIESSALIRENDLLEEVFKKYIKKEFDLKKTA
jgi:hypothetical protein